MAALIRPALWCAAVLALASPAVDAFLDGAQPRFLLVELPAWLGLGWLAGRRMVRAPSAWDPRGLTGLVMFIGSLGFWMIPRSVDAAVISDTVGHLMHANLLIAGLALGRSLPAMPFVVRGALGIYGASMTFALGSLYQGYAVLLCGSFTLTQQREAGRWLLTACPAIVLWVLALGARALVRERQRVAASA